MVVKVVHKLEAEREAREAKLPAWAQKELAHLRGEVESLTGLLNDVRGGSEKRVLAYRDVRGPGKPGGGDPFYLPQYVLWVEAWPDSKEAISIRPLEDEPGYKERNLVQVSSMYGHGLRVHPRAANMIWVESDPR